MTDNQPPLSQPPTFLLHPAAQLHHSITISPGRYGKQDGVLTREGQQSTHPSIHPTLQIPKNTPRTPQDLRATDHAFLAHTPASCGRLSAIARSTGPGRPIRIPRPPLCHRDGHTHLAHPHPPQSHTFSVRPFWGRTHFAFWDAFVLSSRAGRVRTHSFASFGGGHRGRDGGHDALFFFASRGCRCSCAHGEIFPQHTHASIPLFRRRSPAST